MDLLFNPKAISRAVAPWLALVLLAVGAGSVGFDRFVLHPEALRFSNEGRSVVGLVATPSVPSPAVGSRTNYANRSLVAVDDPELGVQLVSIYGKLPEGTPVALRCLTSAHRCLGEEELKERLNLWPLTPLMLAGLTELALAALLALATRRHRVRRTAGRSPVPET